jgi:hypothetical protein
MSLTGTCRAAPTTPPMKLDRASTTRSVDSVGWTTGPMRAAERATALSGPTVVSRSPRYSTRFGARGCNRFDSSRVSAGVFRWVSMPTVSFPGRELERTNTLRPPPLDRRVANHGVAADRIFGARPSRASITRGNVVGPGAAVLVTARRRDPLRRRELAACGFCLVPVGRCILAAVAVRRAETSRCMYPAGHGHGVDRISDIESGARQARRDGDGARVMPARTAVPSPPRRTSEASALRLRLRGWRNGPAQRWLAACGWNLPLTQAAVATGPHAASLPAVPTGRLLRRWRQRRDMDVPAKRRRPWRSGLRRRPPGTGPATEQSRGRLGSNAGGGGAECGRIERMGQAGGEGSRCALPRASAAPGWRAGRCGQ